MSIETEKGSKLKDPSHMPELQPKKYSEPDEDDDVETGYQQMDEPSPVPEVLA